MSSKDLSLRQQIFTMLEKDHELKAKQLCKLMDLDYVQYKNYACKVRSEWKAYRRNRQALKCLSFHCTRGWIFALKSMDRKVALEVGGWKPTKAKNRFLLFKDELGRLEWCENGRIKLWVKKPATWGAVKQLLAKAFLWTRLVDDVEVFDLWSASARFKGAHLVYDLGERIPYSKIDLLKESNGVVVKTGDVSHPSSVEIEFCYPDFNERNEVLIQQMSKALELNSQQIQHFSDLMRDLSISKGPSKPSDHSMVI